MLVGSHSGFDNDSVIVIGFDHNVIKSTILSIRPPETSGGISYTTITILLSTVVVRGTRDHLRPPIRPARTGLYSEHSGIVIPLGGKHAYPAGYDCFLKMGTISYSNYK